MRIDYPFSHHMVLQRNKKIMISGEAKGTGLTLLCAHQEYHTEIKDDRWSLCIFFHQAGGPYEMQFQSDEEDMSFKDVWVGDVFLAGGQSNMELPLEQTNDSKDISFNHQIRVLYVPQYVYPFHTQLQEWEVYDGRVALKYSALIASFVKNLEADIPIGIILNYKGGTSASCWISEKYLKKDALIRNVYWNQYYDGLPSLAQQKQDTKEYYEKFYAYQKRLEEFRNQNPHMNLSQIKEIVGHTPWPPPKSIDDYGRPSCLYENMFLKTVHYPITAVLYYQGEEDSNRFLYYQKLLSLLIDNWREDYQENIPFFIVQLPEYQNSHFHEIRLAQRKVSLEKENTYLVVSLGTGDSSYIHPLSKEELGKRLAFSVNKYLYQKNAPVSPMIKSVNAHNQVIITFDQQLCEGIVHLLVDGEEIEGTIHQNTIIVPIQSYHCLAYACHDVPKIEIMSLDYMPASPFMLYGNNQENK